MRHPLIQIYCTENFMSVAPWQPSPCLPTSRRGLLIAHTNNAHCLSKFWMNIYSSHTLLAVLQNFTLKTKQHTFLNLRNRLFSNSFDFVNGMKNLYEKKYQLLLACGITKRYRCQQGAERTSTWKTSLLFITSENIFKTAPLFYEYEWNCLKEELFSDKSDLLLWI